MAFGFTYLTGTEIAGYTSINALIQSIDTQLTSRIPNKDTSGTGAFNAYVPVYDSTQASGFSQGLITSSNILNGTILDADINASAGIVDTKLATISTAGKVANSATTAASANGNSTIVARDASGNFAADTITASGFVGTATRATNIVGGSAGNIPYQTGTSATGLLASGSDGQVLTYSSSGSAPTWANISSGSVTLAGDVTGAANANSIGTNAVTQAKMADDSVGTAEIINANVTYPKLASNVKTYSVATTATTGVYYTSNDYLTSASVSTVSSQNPFVIANHATVPISLWLPNDIGSAGATITICQLGAASVTIFPNVPGGSLPSINGSTSNTYTLGAQYSIVTLVCLANTGSGSSIWVITGDYI